MFASWVWERALVLRDAATMLVTLVTLEYILLCLFSLHTYPPMPVFSSLN